MPTHELAEELVLPGRTVERIIRALIDNGELTRPEPGMVRVPQAVGQPPQPLPTPEAAALWKILNDEDLPAYLTGLDIVGGFAHHHLIDFPHLVIAELHTGEDLSFTLAGHGFIVMRPGATVEAERKQQLVIVDELRRWRRYQVADHLAPPELAWVDLYRYVKKGVIKIDPWELGAILGNLLDAGFAARRIRTFGRDVSPEIALILDDAPTSAFAHAVRSGAGR